MPNDIDDFLAHRSNDRGGNRLKGWKENGSITVWIHTKHVPRPRWAHRFPRLVVRDDRDTGETRREVWSSDLVCFESEEVLKAQYRRTEDGKREKAPRACPMCRFIEWTRHMVDKGKLHWCRPVFRFDADDPTKSRILHAGGLYNAFGAQDLSDEQLKEMAKYGIYPKTAWQENAMAKLGYLFVVVDNDDLEAGVSVTVETGLLGDKTKEVIRKAMHPRVLGPERGNPMVHPYAIVWSYDEKKRKFDEKYDAFRAEDLKLTPAVERLIRGPAADVSGWVKPFDPEATRAVMEAACLLPKDKVPWDAIFAPPKSEPAEEGVERVPEVSTVARVEEPAAVVDADGDELVACDECGKAMKASASTCPHCGVTYEVEAAVPPPPPPPKPLPKRGSKAKAAAAPAPAPVPSGNKDADPWGLAPEDDESPFG